MPGLTTTLLTAANALTVFDRALATTRNNVANVDTPGYARQRFQTVALPFQPGTGMPGGITAGELASARQEFAEQAVRRQLSQWGWSEASATGLAQVEPLFDARGLTGVPAPLSRLFQSFSSLSLAPNDPVARQAVIDRAGELAAGFNETASATASARSALDAGLRAHVAAVNRIAATLADLNAQLRSDFRAPTDPNLEASRYASLQDLAQYVDFTALGQDDGSVMVLIGGGQAPLVIGDRPSAIEYAAGTGAAAILTADGQDLTAAIRAGRLRGLLDLKNSVLPGYAGELDRLAAAVAARVNGLLAGGLDTAGQAGAALFALHTGAPAATLAVTGIQQSQLAAASAGAPGGNGNALALAALADSVEIDGLSFTAFYGRLAAAVGRDVENARASADAGERLYQAASALRDDDAKVSLDEQAARLVEFQRAYESVARVIMVLDELTETAIGLLRPGSSGEWMR